MVDEIEVLPAPPVRNRRHEVAGLGILATNFLRHRILGKQLYRKSPRGDAEESYRYSRAVVSKWLAHLARYLHARPALEDWDALEIDPGPDLGTGLVLLGEGLRRYAAIGAHPLAKASSTELHPGICRRVAAQTGHPESVLRTELEKYEAGERSRVDYLQESSMALDALADERFDLFLGHAAFEHLDDVSRTIEGMSAHARENALLVSEIDLQTHSRWIRDLDPLNIYRYREGIYRGFSFPGIPNRVRPDGYMEALVKQGWRDIRFFPRRVLPPQYVERVHSTLAPRFRGDQEHLGWLSVVICARYQGRAR